MTLDELIHLYGNDITVKKLQNVPYGSPEYLIEYRKHFLFICDEIDGDIILKEFVEEMVKRINLKNDELYNLIK